MVVVIPVTIPENPSIVSIEATTSFENLGKDAITAGGFDTEYPPPALVIVNPFIAPLLTVTVAVPVVPTPTGDAMDIVADDPTYPLPPLLITSDEIVPLAAITAVIPAPTGSTDGRINPDT